MESNNYRMRKIISCLIILLSHTVSGGVYNLNNIPNPKTTDKHAYVGNPDNIIRKETAEELNTLLDSLEQTTLTEVAIVLVESIGDENIEMFTTDLFKKWGVGKAQSDNGLLILFVLDQRAIRFETGYGIEGLLPDALISRILEQSIYPYFKAGDYDSGFLKGTRHLISILKQEVFEEAENSNSFGVTLPLIFSIYLTIGLIAFLWIISTFKKVQKNPELDTNISKFKVLKQEKESVLAIINILLPIILLFVILVFFDPLWLLFLPGIPISTVPANLYAKMIMRKIRRKPIPCTACGGTMHILSEKKEDAFLKLSQQFEEKLHSIDYDVFVCDDCGNETVFSLDKPSMYTECSKCKTKAFALHDRKIMIAPTYISGGTERITYKCMFCGYEKQEKKHLPKLTRSRSISYGGSTGSFSGGGGSFGGGGGGSFGGGSSGGGGVTGRW